MVLAMGGASDVHLVESDTKKIAFLREVARLTKTAVSLHHSRIEDLMMGHADIVVSRALQPLNQLLSLAFPYVSHGTICLFHKGKIHSKEIGEANENWFFETKIIPSVTDSQGVILELRNISKR